MFSINDFERYRKHDYKLQVTSNHTPPSAISCGATYAQVSNIYLVAVYGCTAGTDR